MYFTDGCGPECSCQMEEIAMDIVPLTPAEDMQLVEDAQRLEWERAQLTGEPGTVEPTAGQLGLCCMTRDEAKADAESVFATFYDLPTPAPESILMEAERIVNGARRGSYGTPENNFGRIAALWTAYLNGKPNGPLPITPQDTALMMIGMKMARLIETPRHRDSIVDIAGYAACVETLWQNEDDSRLANER